MANENTATGATVPMEDVSGIDQDIIREVLAEGNISAQQQSAPQNQNVQTDEDDDWPGEENAAPAPQPGQQVAKPPKGYVPLQALQEERQQRQQLQQQISNLTTMFQQMQQSQMNVNQPAANQPAAAPQPAAAAPAPSDDPLAAMLRSQLEVTLPQYMKPMQELQQYIQQQQQQAAQQATQQRIANSVNQARSKYADFEQVIAPIEQRMQTDPNFNSFILGLPDPAEYAYMMALGLQAQTQRTTQGQAQVQKLQQMAAMPRSQQIQGSTAPLEYQNLEDLINNFERLTPAQQERLLKMTGV